MQLIVKPYKLKEMQAGYTLHGAKTYFPNTFHLPEGTWIWCIKLEGSRNKYHFDGAMTEAHANEIAERIAQGQEPFVPAKQPMRILGTNEQSIIAARRDGQKPREMWGK